MEVITFICAYFLFLFIALKFLKKSRGKNPSLKLPPGPNPLPIIGNIHQLFGFPLLHHLLRDLANKFGPLMHLKLGETSTIIVTSPEMAKQIFNTHDIAFSARPSHHVANKIMSYNFNDIVFSPYGDYWKQVRKICTVELLSPKRVQDLKSIREGEVFILIKSISWQKGSSVNLSRSLFALTYGFTSRAAFGKIDRGTQRFIQCVEEITRGAAGFSLADMYPSVKLLQVMSYTRYKLEAVQKQVDEVLGNILNEHKEKIKEAREEDIGEGKEDLVDVLLRIQKREDSQPQLTDTNIKGVLFDIFSAGGESSATTMGWAISEMIRNPEIMKRAQEEVRNIFNDKGNVDESQIHELKYLHAIIKETFRLHPSAPLLLPRECREQCQINGYDIPAKARILVNAWAIGRDPNHWVEAEKFNPSRFLDSDIDYKGNDFKFVPFGAGRRICPGISFSKAIIVLVLAQLIFHFDWKLPTHEELDMFEQFGVTMKRKNDVILIPILHDGSCMRMDD